MSRPDNRRPREHILADILQKRLDLWLERQTMERLEAADEANICDELVRCAEDAIAHGRTKGATVIIAALREVGGCNAKRK